MTRKYIPSKFLGTHIYFQSSIRIQIEFLYFDIIFLQQNLMNRKNLCKAIFLGDSAVGKTSILKSFAEEKFVSAHKATIGADIIELQLEISGKMLNLVLLDTAGQERFRSLGQAFYRGVDCCVLVYDVTNKQTLKHIESWMHEFLEKGAPEDPEGFPFVLVGNKIDKTSSIEVMDEDLREFEQRYPKVKSTKVSAKNREGLKDLFNIIGTSSLLAKKQQIFIPEMIKIREKDRTIRKDKKVCC